MYTISACLYLTIWVGTPRFWLPPSRGIFISYYSRNPIDPQAPWGDIWSATYDAHAQEVADLPRELLGNGKTVAYDEIMDAVSDFDMVNAKLAAILEKLNVEEF